ncbi:MAG: serine/threonine-protein kinase [Planctomycetota bacterium]|nr:serine/threonine-protein kinase [Planctomycetota bacterium]
MERRCATAPSAAVDVVPVAFFRAGSPRLCAPIAALDVRLGSDSACDIVEPGAAPHHARLRYVKGEWLLAGEDDLRVEVNGAWVPLLTLRPGDVVRLAPGGGSFTFQDRLAGTFVPPGTSLAAAWQTQPAFRDPASGPRAAPGVVVKQGLACRRPEDAERHLQLLARLGGAPHPAVAPLIDGGLHPLGAGVGRWLATAYVPGSDATALVSGEGLQPAQAIAVLARVAGGLAHLHARGVIHRDVAPGNVVLGPDGAVLIDFGQAVLADRALAPSAGVVGTPGYVAPEEVLEGPSAVSCAVDIYGLCAVVYALLVGTPPAAGGHVLDALSRAGSAPVSPRALGIDLPGAVETALLAGLDGDPSARPSARELESIGLAAGVPARLGGRS